MTTPNEFLRFAQEITQTNHSQNITDETPISTSKTLTGLLVLNNICHLIEQHHALKLENQRLRAHLDLIDHVNRFCLKSSPSNPSIPFSEIYDDEEKSPTLSPSNSFKRKLSISSKDRLGVDLVNHQEELRTSHLSIEPDPDRSSSGNKLRHAWIFSRGKKKSSSSHQYLDRPIPLISISTDHDQTHQSVKQSKLVQYGQRLRSKFSSAKRPLDESTLLTAQFAPAMTRSYQEKMRQWESLQKSDFLINYRRQSITTTTSSLTPKVFRLSPILSPYQRSLILHQWREIVDEEISLRQHQQTLQETLTKYQQLETQLKELKARIFATPDVAVKHRSISSLEPIDGENLLPSFNLPHRSRSLQSLVPMPNSWLLAVQSAAYSDILDGTTEKTTEKAMGLKRCFFQRLEHWKEDRRLMESRLIQDLQTKSVNLTKKSTHRLILTRAHLHKPLPVLTIPPAVSPLECTFIETPPRNRFDFRRTLQRSRSLCLSHLHSWLHRRRTPTRHAEETGEAQKTRKQDDLHDNAEIHRIMNAPEISPSNPHADDSDSSFPYRELPIRIYFPARPVRVLFPKVESLRQPTTPPMTRLTSPVLHRRRQQFCLDI